MFLLPIILWWGRAPLRFAEGLSRIVICNGCAVVIAAVATCGAAPSAAEDRWVPQAKSPQANWGAESRSLQVRSLLVRFDSGSSLALAADSIRHRDVTASRFAGKGEIRSSVALGATPGPESRQGGDQGKHGSDNLSYLRRGGHSIAATFTARYDFRLLS